MNTGGEAAEQIVRMSLEGFEVAAKITGGLPQSRHSGKKPMS